jgi:acetyl esterase
MPLDSEVQELLERMERSDPRPRGSWTIAETREKYLQMRVLAGEPKDLRRVEDRTVPGPAGEIPIRLYARETGIQLPALIYLHGGRFISGNLDTHDRVCRALAEQSGCLIVGVDYRLAPEHRFPAAVEDAYCVTAWTAAHGGTAGVDITRIGVGGDSAGGNLAAAVALHARDKDYPPLKCQCLIYPMLDATRSAETHRTLAAGYGAGSDDMKQGYREYVPKGVDLRDPLVSPLFAENLKGVPPAFVLTAEYDCLRAEAEQYVEQLRSAGVTVVHSRYEGAIHGFFQMAGVLGIGVRAIDEVSGFLKDSLQPLSFGRCSESL